MRRTIVVMAAAELFVAAVSLDHQHCFQCTCASLNCGGDDEEKR